jgi:hypothetical protein
MRIEEEYIRTGYFWLPEKDNEKIPGVLTIKDGGDIELEIVGYFDEEIVTISNNNSHLGRIIGHVEKDGLVTLENCFYTEQNYSFFGGISKSKVCVNQVLSGVAYEKDEIVTFNTLSFSVDCMDEWVGISGITVNSDWNNKITSIIYSPPDNIVYSLDNGMELCICFAYTVPFFAKVNEAKITQKAYFKLKSDSLKPLNDFISLVYKIVNFMCFAIDDTISLKNVSATSSEIQRESSGSKNTPIEIKIFYSSIPYVAKIPIKTSNQMLFNYGIIKTNAQSIFNNWINAYEVISPALNLYFSTKVGAQKYLDGKFLSLIQGLETYQRRTNDEQLMNTDDFNKLVETIMKNCPEENKEWLNGRLRYGNEINLAKRIKSIMEPFKNFLGNNREREKLIRKIVDTRNYYTHYNKDLENKAADGTELWQLCQIMEFIYQLHFLRVIGFTDLEITNVVENSYSMMNILKKV